MDSINFRGYLPSDELRARYRLPGAGRITESGRIQWLHQGGEVQDTFAGAPSLFGSQGDQKYVRGTGSDDTNGPDAAVPGMNLNLQADEGWRVMHLAEPETRTLNPMCFV